MGVDVRDKSFKIYHKYTHLSHRERDRERQRQTDGRTGRQTERQRDRETKTKQNKHSRLSTLLNV